MPPSRYDIALDMTGLTAIAHYDPGDLTLSVDAGMPLQQLEKVLVEKQQFLPLAVPCYETSTVGGAVASGIDSSLRQQFGTVRDFLIGAEFVDGHGNLCKSGGRVVKNVTGYDLHKLLIGSLGTLAAITRLNFRTFPMPQEFGGFVASFASVEGALNYRAHVEKSGMPTANLELISPEAAEIARGILEKRNARVTGFGKPGQWGVYASYEGNASVVERISRDLDKLARIGQAAGSERLEDSTVAIIDGALREAFDWLRRAAPQVALFRATLPRVTPADFGELSAIAVAASLRSASIERAAGVVYFASFAEDETQESVEALQKSAEGVFAFAGAMHGHAVMLHAPLEVKKRVNVWGPKRADWTLHQGVKRAFDPRGIFAPWRFVGGL
jgi:glycolate oxidase FAD binding subunit